jgi:hypothetical protein
MARSNLLWQQRQKLRMMVATYWHLEVINTLLEKEHLHID